MSGIICYYFNACACINQSEKENFTKMDGEEIRIVTLPPMRMASFYAFGKSPETSAYAKMATWAEAHSCWLEPPAVRAFGFNNPDPAEGSPNYGYEFWLTIDPAVQQEEEFKIKDFSGGLYAVLNCYVSGSPWEIIPTTWGRLVKWCETSHYQYGNHQWLEEHLTRNKTNDKDFVLDLYLPISE
jgi:AraC family transcriptional regulator